MRTLCNDDVIIGPQNWIRYYPFFLEHIYDVADAGKYLLLSGKFDEYHKNCRHLIADRMKAAIMDDAHIRDTIVYFGGEPREKYNLVLLDNVIDWLNQIKMEYRKNG